MVKEPFNDWIVIGEVLKGQGLHGEVKVRLLTDHPERFEPGAVLQLKKKSSYLF
jgi:ribosomal 30S subunit maturation factor RimM